jgi:radical SAM superfamily enzyme YgiQ (UPF0313 family)
MLIIVPKYKLWVTSHPLGALYIAAVLKKRNIPVELIDGVCEPDYYPQIRAKAEGHSDIGISANIAQAYSGCETAKFLRQNFPEKRIIWGGPYASIEYKRLIPELADIVVIGEGEEQAAAIADNLPLKDIPGIAYWDKEKKQIVTNPRQEFIQDLNTLPYPAWELTAGNRYAAPGTSPSFIIVTERGCPFHCINCTKVVHGDKFRSRSVEHIAGELELLVDKYGAKEFHIWDDNFTLYPKRTKEICRAIIAKGIHKKARFVLPNGIRADICDEEMFDLMREANFQVVIIAIESADQKVIDKLQKGLDLEKVRKTVNMVVDKGFRVGLFFMMGLPFDTTESLKKTANFAASLPAHHVFFWKVTPFPGTKLYDITIGTNEHSTDYTSGYVDYESKGKRFDHPNLTQFQLTYYMRIAYIKFYGNPIRLFRILKKMSEQKVLLSDLKLLLRCGINLLFTGRR